jgi:hypothetical protein
MARFADRPVIRIEPGLQEKDCRDAARHASDLSNLVNCERTAQYVSLPVGKPFLDYLIPADGIAPHVGRDVPPIDHAVEVDLEGGSAQAPSGTEAGLGYVVRGYCHLVQRHFRAF